MDCFKKNISHVSSGLEKELTKSHPKDNLRNVLCINHICIYLAFLSCVARGQNEGGSAERTICTKDVIFIAFVRTREIKIFIFPSGYFPKSVRARRDAGTRSVR